MCSGLSAPSTCCLWGNNLGSKTQHFTPDGGVKKKEPSRQLTVNWQPTMLKFHWESDFHLPQSQNCGRLLDQLCSSYFCLRSQKEYKDRKGLFYFFIFVFSNCDRILSVLSLLAGQEETEMTFPNQWCKPERGPTSKEAVPFQNSVPTQTTLQLGVKHEWVPCRRLIYHSMTTPNYKFPSDAPYHKNHGSPSVKHMNLFVLKGFV